MSYDNYNIQVTHKGHIFLFKKIHEYTKEKIQKFIECIELLEQHKDKQLIFIDDCLPYNDNIFYDCTNLILYYYGEKFYNFEILDIREHLILMTVFNKFQDIITFVNEKEGIDYEYKKYLGIKNKFYDIDYGCVINTTEKAKMVNLQYAYDDQMFINYVGQINSVDAVKDYMACRNIIFENQKLLEEHPELFDENGIESFNIRSTIQPLLDMLQSNKIADI